MRTLPRGSTRWTFVFMFPILLPWRFPSPAFCILSPSQEPESADTAQRRYCTMAAKPRRIAAIDVGTNSVHMIVAETRERGYRVVDREKEMVQLGLASLDGQPLTDGAIERGVATIGRMAEIAAKWNVDEIVAVATSAVREAPNRRDFLRGVKEATGVKVRVISGEEEADYIFRAVRSAVEVGLQTALCIDIGGGSVELIVGKAHETHFTRSEPPGAVRL